MVSVDGVKMNHSSSAVMTADSPCGRIRQISPSTRLLTYDTASSTTRLSSSLLTVYGVVNVPLIVKPSITTTRAKSTSVTSRYIVTRPS